MIDSDLTRAWCLALAADLKRQAIDRDGKGYLMRFFAAGWNPWTRHPGAAIYLHHFVNSDDATTVHSHPWQWSASLILVGGYREIRCVDGVDTVREYHPGDVNVLRPDDHHRIELLEADCWTLFLAGPYQQPWAFFPVC